LVEKDLINKYLGFPYKHQGRDVNGVDCWGLIKLVYKDFLNVDLLDTKEDYANDWAVQGKNYFIENYYKEWDKTENPILLDIVLFKNINGIANHAGLYLSQNKILHTCKLGTIITKLNSFNLFKLTLEGFYRYKNK